MKRSELETEQAMKFDVVSFGDLVADVLLPIPRLPVLPDDIQLAHQMSIEPGGACNFLIMAERLGLHSAALGSVGDDAYGSLILQKLRGEGVETGGVNILVGQKTTGVIILIDDQGQHAFLGALGTIQTTGISAALIEKISHSRALFTNGYAFLESLLPGIVIEVMQLARQNNTLVIFDPGPQIQQIEPGLIRKGISLTDYLLLTQEEAAALAGGESAEETARNLLKLGPRMVVLKLGAQGSLSVSAQTSLRTPALAVNVRDTSGAGDAFDAAFVYGIMQGMSLEQIGKLANAAGGLTVSRVGAGTALPLKVEIEAHL